MVSPQIKAGTRLPLTRTPLFDRDASNRPLAYMGVSFTTPISVQNTTFRLALTLEYEDTWFSCKSFTALGCTETCPAAQTSVYTAQRAATGCVVTANATLVSDDAVLVQDFAAGFAQGEYADGIARNNVKNLGADGVLGLGSSVYMPSWKSTLRDSVLDFVDSFSLSLASDNAFVMLNGVDNALIAANAWMPVPLLLTSSWASTWQLEMTAFQVDGLANVSAALFPCASSSQVTKSGSCSSRLTTGLSYISMPGWLFEAFEDKYLHKQTGCMPSFSLRQENYKYDSRMYVCPSDVTLPRLAFTFGNATLYLDSKDYVAPKEGDAAKVLVEITGSTHADFWELGVVFLEKFYMTYRNDANATVYCRAGDQCALNVVTNPEAPKDSATWGPDASRDHARGYFGVNATTANRTTTPDNETKSPSPTIFLAIIGVVLALVVMTAAACWRHKRRKQQAAKMAASDGDAFKITTPVGGDEVGASSVSQRQTLLLVQRRTRPSRPQTPPDRALCLLGVWLSKPLYNI